MAELIVQVCEPNHLNAIDSIGAIVATTLEEDPLEAYFSEQSDFPSRWNLYWTKPTVHEWSLELDNPVFGKSWTKYWGAHTWLNCQPKQPCECEGHNCLRTHSTEGHAPATAPTAKPVPIPLSVIEPPTPTPSEIDSYIWHWSMWQIHSHVRIRRAWPGGAGVCGQSGNHRWTRQQQCTGHRVHSEPDAARNSTEGVEEGGAVYWTWEHHTDGLPSSGTDNRIQEADDRPTGSTVSALPVQSYRDENQYPMPDDRAGQSQGETRSSSDRQGAMAAIRSHDTRRTAIRRGTLQSADAASQCSHVCRQGGTSSSRGSGRWRPENSGLPGHSWVGSNSVERLDCSNANCNSTQTCQFSRWTVEDVVHIWPRERRNLGWHLATRPAERRYRTVRHTILYRTPGSSLWGP